MGKSTKKVNRFLEMMKILSNLLFDGIGMEKESNNEITSFT